MKIYDAEWLLSAIKQRQFSNDRAPRARIERRRKRD